MNPSSRIPNTRAVTVTPTLTHNISPARHARECGCRGVSGTAPHPTTIQYNTIQYNTTTVRTRLARWVCAYCTVRDGTERNGRLKRSGGSCIGRKSIGRVVLRCVKSTKDNYEDDGDDSKKKIKLEEYWKPSIRACIEQEEQGDTDDVMMWAHRQKQ